jgi:Flp pilus assembly protein TadG
MTLKARNTRVYRTLNLFINKISKSEKGSASIEFSLLAIPLFIPLFIFMSQFSHASDAQDSLRTLARETARAFVTSKDDETAHFVANQILIKGADLLGYDTDSADRSIAMKITCGARPCIAPDNSILVELRMKSPNGIDIEVAAIEYVSPWA